MASYQAPREWEEWSNWLAAGLHGRSRWRLSPLLMGLLFVLGVMNLLWIAALAAFVLLEKVVPAGQRLSKATGLLLVGWGVVVAARLLG